MAQNDQKWLKLAQNRHNKAICVSFLLDLRLDLKSMSPRLDLRLDLTKIVSLYPDLKLGQINLPDVPYFDPISQLAREPSNRLS